MDNPSEQIEVAESPQITISFDSKSQSVQVATKGIGNLDFALGMIEMAKTAVTFQRNMVVGNAMMQQQAQMQQDVAIAKRVANGRFPR